ncbi:sugar ABC transporter permease [Marispirochaeta sp.]|jgi:alpha-1,4-digalacturonate transport system permease protein|uniref:carbohydrate ABC transporter permease n=1 Tax=Marispirochaeta sp. TaxID=2038653 RepID=UPI0029C74012|nr:sugar ABC transporter permease [Marispirochaeta sp.]
MKKRKQTHGTFEQTLTPLLFLTPNMLIFAIFIILPAVFGLRMAFFEWSILGGKTFIGFENFLRIFQDDMFWRTLSNTVIYVASVVPLIIICSLALSLIASHHVPGIGVFRAFYYLPTMLSFVIVGIAWRWILGDDLGILNYLIVTAGRAKIHWLTDSAMAKFSLVLVTVWNRTGYFMMMFIGGLTAIPETYYEAAHMDGASRFQMFRHITLPLLRPTVMVVGVLSTIEAFKAFELIFVMTGGGPGYSTKFLVQNIYQIAFEEDRMGYAASMSIVLLLIIGAFTFFQFFMNRREYANE